LLYIKGRVEGAYPLPYPSNALFISKCFFSGKWHLGWDKDTYGDQVHGPLGHGFDSFYGLPFTLADGFEMEMPFWTYSGWMSSKEVKRLVLEG
jgi:hypothetical protein